MPFKERKVCRKIFESGWLKNAAFILIHSSAQPRALAFAAMLFCAAVYSVCEGKRILP